VFETAPEKLRCITCNLKSIDLESEKRKASGVSAPKPAPSKSSLSEGGEVSTKKQEPRTSVYRQKISKMAKIMDAFDKQSGLTLQDFKRL